MFLCEINIINNTTFKSFSEYWIINMVMIYKPSSTMNIENILFEVYS